MLSLHFFGYLTNAKVKLLDINITHVFNFRKSQEQVALYVRPHNTDAQSV